MSLVPKGIRRLRTGSIRLVEDEKYRERRSVNMMITPPAFLWKHFNRRTAKVVSSKICKILRKLKSNKIFLWLTDPTRKRALGNSLAVPPMVKYTGTIWPTNSIPRYKQEINENLCPHKILSMNNPAGLFIIAKKGKWPKCPLVVESMNKMWYTHIMEYCSAMQRNEVLSHATTWMDLGNIILSERSPTHKTTSCVVPFT